MDDEAVEPGTCALDGCGNPLPHPARDEQGRLKGGKPVRYCCKAHADEASRRRRALESVGVDEPLHLLRRLGGQTREVMDAALRELTEIRKRWDELDAGAVAQSAKDRAETAAAILKAEKAQREVDDAVRVRAEALAAAAKDQQRRKAAEEAAETAIQEAEQVKKAAWAQTAEHERARGQAETRAALAEKAQRDALDQLAAAHRELRDLTAVHQDTQQKLGHALAAADRADAARTLAEAKAGAADERARLAGDAAQRAQQDTGRAQEETQRAREEAAKARAAESEAKAAHSVAAQRLSSQDQEIRDLRRQLAEARERERALLEHLVARGVPGEPGEQVEGG